MITRSSVIGDERREAVFSDDEIFRYSLDITWDPSLRTLATIALNPSTATHEKDDNTIRACKKLARAMNFGSYRMLNCFALRSTDYKALFRAEDPIGPSNTIEFLKHWCDGTFVIACWGAHITEKRWRHHYRGHEIAEQIPDLHALKVTQSGHPQHPLYISASVRPLPFAYAN